MTTGAPKRLMRGILACLLVLLCSFGLCGCDFGDLFKTTKDKQAAPTEQPASSEGKSATEGSGGDAASSEAAQSSSSGEAGSSSSSGSSSSGESGSEPAPEPEPEAAMLSIHVLVDASNIALFHNQCKCPLSQATHSAIRVTGQASAST